MKGTAVSIAAGRTSAVHLCILILIASLPANSQSFTTFVSQLQRLPLERRASSVDRFITQTPSIPVVEDDSLLHFVYYGPAHSVGVNGNLQRWNDPDSMTAVACGDNTFFYRTYTVPSDARLDYQLVVDGTYQLDPLNPRITPSGYGPHSEVQMPSFVPTPYRLVNDSVPKGTVEELNLFLYLDPPLSRYTILGRPLKIYLPFGYDTLSGLPAVYVHDGFEAIGFADMPVILDNLIAQKKIGPVIAVFIPPVIRQNEYLTDHREKFVSVVCNELVPMIDRRFRTSRDPGKRAVMGISNGGHFSLYTAMSRPDVFLNAGGQSPTISPALIERTKERSAEEVLPPTMKIYLDCGRYDIRRYHPVWGNIDFLESNREYSELLSSLRIPHFFREVNDGHEWASWRERMPDMLMFFFGRFR